MGLLGSIGHAIGQVAKAPVKLAKKIDPIGVKGIQFGATYAKNSLSELKRRPLIGAARIAVSFTGVGAVGLAAYDAKRLQDRTRSAKDKLRHIKRQALIDGDAIEKRLRPQTRPGVAAIGPVQDKLNNGLVVRPSPKRPGFVLNPVTGLMEPVLYAQGTALPGPDIESRPAPGRDTLPLSAPTPEQRGAGGDAAEGTKTTLAGVGGTAIPVLAVFGLLAASWAARRAS